MKKKESIFPYIIIFTIIPIVGGLFSFIDGGHLPTFWDGFLGGILIDLSYIIPVQLFKLYTKIKSF